MLLKIAQKFSEQGSTDIFVPGFMVTYCHARPSLAVPSVKKASLITRTSETVSQTASQMNRLTIANTVNRPFVIISLVMRHQKPLF